MKRSQGWFVLALTAACSSESPSDDMAALMTSGQSPVASQPTNTGTSPATGGAPSLGTSTDDTPPQQTMNAPPANMPPATVVQPSPMPQPMPTMTAPVQTGTGAGGDPSTEMTATAGAGGAEGPSSGGAGGSGGAASMGGSGGTPAGGAPMEETGGAMTSGGAAGAPMEEGGECTVGTTTGNEVVIIGESFIAASSIGRDLSQLAIDNGSLQPGDAYIDNSVSGTRLGDGAIPGQYTSAQQSNDIRFVLMDGGGNDCLQANDSNTPISAAEGLFEQMAADGVEKVVYFFYPDPAGAFGGGGSSLKTCLDELRPKMKAVCDGLTSPKCYWLDLRETSWTGNESNYTSDGIHPNAEGSRVTAEAIWEVMVENCVAQ